MRQLKPGRQAGMTLVECLASMAISLVLLAGLSGILDIGFAGYQENQQFAARLGNIDAVIARLTWAIESAERKKGSELVDKTGRDHTSDTWFDRKDATGKIVALRYEWNSVNKTLNEYDGMGIPQAILADVADFRVTSPFTTDTSTALILVTLTVQRNDVPVTFTLSRSLGGPW